MKPIWDAGISLIRLLQTIGWLELPMLAITQLGSEIFFLLLVPLLYWCVSARLGIRAGLILLLSNSLNSALKVAAAGPRPYWYSPEVRALASEPSFGLPSGHAQNAVAVFGAIAAFGRRRRICAAALLLMLLIGLSRLYLGVHFPTDVLAGWALGALLLWAFGAWFDRAAGWVGRRALIHQIELALVSSLLLLAPCLLLVLARASWQLPEPWLQRALLAFPGDGAPQPLSLDTPISAAGTWLGFGVGAAWLATTRPFHVEGPPWRRLARYLLGMAVVLAIWAGLRAVFPQGATPLAYALRYLRYALIGTWVAAGAPVLFRAIGLSADTPTPAPLTADLG